MEGWGWFKGMTVLFCTIILLLWWTPTGRKPKQVKLRDAGWACGKHRHISTLCQPFISLFKSSTSWPYKWWQNRSKYQNVFCWTKCWHTKHHSTCLKSNCFNTFPSRTFPFLVFIISIFRSIHTYTHSGWSFSLLELSLILPCDGLD